MESPKGGTPKGSGTPLGSPKQSIRSKQVDLEAFLRDPDQIKNLEDLSECPNDLVHLLLKFGFSNVIKNQKALSQRSNEQSQDNKYHEKLHWTQSDRIFERV